jgi:hypothetical protein
MSVRLWAPSYWALLVLLTGAFGMAALRIAPYKAFWLDEYHSLDASIRSARLGQLIVAGAQGQGSPAPLDYLLVKGLDGARAAVRYFGLQPAAYYRLVAFAATLIPAFLVGSIARSRWDFQSPPGIFVSSLILFAVFAGLYRAMSTRYIVEMRPYAMWQGLWYLALVCFFSPRRLRAASVPVLCLLAFTATASLFQILALCVSFAAVRLALGDGQKQVAQEAACLFAAPACISLYYCLRTEHWPYQAAEYGTWPTFLMFWCSKHNVLVLVSSVAATALAWHQPRTRAFAVPGLATAVLYLMGPFIFFLTRRQGFFFASRQYFYYELAFPIFFLTVARCYPALVPSWRPGRLATLRTAVLAFAAFVAIRYCATGLAWVADAFHPRDHGIGVFVDPRGEVRKLLDSELPLAFVVSDRERSASANTRMVADWLPVQYPNLPQGRQVVLLWSFPQDRAEVVCVSARLPSGGEAIPVVAKGRP